MRDYKIISDISLFNKEDLAKEINEIIKEGWGDFGIEYVKKHIIESDLITIATHQGRVVGFVAAKKYIVYGRTIYYLEFACVSVAHRGKNLSGVLNRKIFEKMFIRNLLKLKFCVEIITISPNPRILGTISRTSSVFYPNPKKNEPIPKKIWTCIKKTIELIGDPYTNLNKRNLVIEGFYSDTPHLIYEPQNVPKDKSDVINEFAKKHLKYSERRGREFVIYAKYFIRDLFKKND